MSVISLSSDDEDDCFVIEKESDDKPLEPPQVVLIVNDDINYDDISPEQSGGEEDECNSRTIHSRREPTEILPEITEESYERPKEVVHEPDPLAPDPADVAVKDIADTNVISRINVRPEIEIPVHIISGVCSNNIGCGNESVSQYTCRDEIRLTDPKTFCSDCPIQADNKLLDTVPASSSVKYNHTVEASSQNTSNTTMETLIKRLTKGLTDHDSVDKKITKGKRGRKRKEKPEIVQQSNNGSSIELYSDNIIPETVNMTSNNSSVGFFKNRNSVNKPLEYSSNKVSDIVNKTSSVERVILDVSKGIISHNVIKFSPESHDGLKKCGKGKRGRKRKEKPEIVQQSNNASSIGSPSDNVIPKTINMAYDNSNEGFFNNHDSVMIPLECSPNKVPDEVNKISNVEMTVFDVSKGVMSHEETSLTTESHVGQKKCEKGKRGRKRKEKPEIVQKSKDGSSIGLLSYKIIPETKNTANNNSTEEVFSNHDSVNIPLGSFQNKVPDKKSRISNGETTVFDVSKGDISSDEITLSSEFNDGLKIIGKDMNMHDINSTKKIFNKIFLAAWSHKSLCETNIDKEHISADSENLCSNINNTVSITKGNTTNTGNCILGRPENLPLCSGNVNLTNTENHNKKNIISRDDSSNMFTNNILLESANNQLLEIPEKGKTEEKTLASIQDDSNNQIHCIMRNKYKQLSFSVVSPDEDKTGGTAAKTPINIETHNGNPDSLLLKHLTAKNPIKLSKETQELSKEQYNNSKNVVANQPAIVAEKIAVSENRMNVQNNNTNILPDNILSLRLDFLRCYNKVFDESAETLCTRMGDFLLLTMKETRNCKARIKNANKFTCKELRLKEAELAKEAFHNCLAKYRKSFADMFRNIYLTIMTDKVTINQRKALIIALFLKLFFRVIKLSPEFSDDIIEARNHVQILIKGELNRPFLLDVFYRNEQNFERDCIFILEFMQFCHGEDNRHSEGTPEMSSVKTTINEQSNYSREISPEQYPESSLNRSAHTSNVSNACAIAEGSATEFKMQLNRVPVIVSNSKQSENIVEDHNKCTTTSSNKCQTSQNSHVNVSDMTNPGLSVVPQNIDSLRNESRIINSNERLRAGNNIQVSQSVFSTPQSTFKSCVSPNVSLDRFNTNTVQHSLVQDKIRDMFQGKRKGSTEIGTSVNKIQKSTNDQYMTAQTNLNPGTKHYPQYLPIGEVPVNHQSNLLNSNTRTRAQDHSINFTHSTTSQIQLPPYNTILPRSGFPIVNPQQRLDDVSQRQFLKYQDLNYIQFSKARDKQYSPYNPALQQYMGNPYQPPKYPGVCNQYPCNLQNSISSYPYFHNQQSMYNQSVPNCCVQPPYPQNVTVPKIPVSQGTSNRQMTDSSHYLAPGASSCDTMETTQQSTSHSLPPELSNVNVMKTVIQNTYRAQSPNKSFDNIQSNPGITINNYSITNYIPPNCTKEIEQVNRELSSQYVVDNNQKEQVNQVKSQDKVVPEILPKETLHYRSMHQ